MRSATADPTPLPTSSTAVLTAAAAAAIPALSGLMLFALVALLGFAAAVKMRM